jgi:hypothetical protein
MKRLIAVMLLLVGNMFLTAMATAMHNFGTSTSNLRGQCFPLLEKDVVGYDPQALLFAVKGLVGLHW